MGNREHLRYEKNRHIRKNVLIYLVVMLALVGIFLMAKYSFTGSVSISVGVISAIILRNVGMLKEGYDYGEPPPSWFVPLLVFSALITLFGGIILCNLLSKYLYEVTGGRITPWSLFAIVTSVMSGVFICSLVLMKGKKGNVSRFYIWLMLVAACLMVGQCVGSLSHSKDLEQEEWLKESKME